MKLMSSDWCQDGSWRGMNGERCLQKSSRSSSNLDSHQISNSSTCLGLDFAVRPESRGRGIVSRIIWIPVSAQCSGVCNWTKDVSWTKKRSESQFSDDCVAMIRADLAGFVNDSTLLLCNALAIHSAIWHWEYILRRRWDLNINQLSVSGACSQNMTIQMLAGFANARKTWLSRFLAD